MTIEEFNGTGEFTQLLMGAIASLVAHTGHALHVESRGDDPNARLVCDTCTAKYHMTMPDLDLPAGVTLGDVAILDYSLRGGYSRKEYARLRDVMTALVFAPVGA